MRGQNPYLYAKAFEGVHGTGKLAKNVLQGKHRICKNDQNSGGGWGANYFTLALSVFD